MARIFIYTTPARGHLYPIMETALALKARGHHVCVQTLADQVKTVESAGLVGRPIDPRIEARAVDDWQVSSPIDSVKRSLQTFVDRAPFELDDLKQGIAEERPDLLVVDTNAWGAQAVAEMSGLPWATWHPYPMAYPSKDAPPFGPGLAPAKGLLGRLRDALLRPLVTRPIEAFVTQLNAVRVKAGAPPLESMSAMFLRPPAILVQTAEPFEYRRSDWPKNMHLVGPGLWSPPSEKKLALPSEKPVVLVTCSTEFQDDGALVDAALGALAGDDSVQLVVTTAGVDPSKFNPPKGVVLEKFVPHASVLPRACVVVCHGGMGITQRALAAGVPVCVVPWGRDQLEVARRAVECGAGSMVSRGKLSPARLRAAVDEARKKTDAAARAKAGYMAAGGASRAANVLQDLVAARASHAELVESRAAE